LVGRPSPGARGAGFSPGAINSFSIFLLHLHFLKIFRFPAPRPHPLNSIQAQAAFACGPDGPMPKSFFSRVTRVAVEAVPLVKSFCQNPDTVDNPMESTRRASWVLVHLSSAISIVPECVSLCVLSG
jgi:hypothetical protein